MNEADLQSNSTITFNPLKNEANIKALNAFEQIIGTSIGPHAHLKYITNTEGGVGTLTSSSKRLLPNISFKNTLLKLIVKSVNNHLVVYKNGGLLTTYLILQLIKHSTSSEYFLPLIGKLFEHYGRLFINFLKKECNDCIRDMNWSNLSHMKSVVETILHSKPQCHLSPDAIKHLSILLMKAHLNTLHDTTSTHIQRKMNFMALPNDKPTNSRLFDGLLIKFPEVSKDLNHFVWTNKEQFKNNVDSFKKACNVKIVLYTTSLSGDADFPVDKIEVDKNVNVWKAVLKFLKELVERIIKMNIHIFACQKVIHPSLRKQLENADILVLDRLGHEVANNLQYLSGSCNSSFFNAISVGCVTSICVEKFGTRPEDPKYLLLTNKEKPFQTLLVRNFCTQAVEETKVLCEQVLDTLWRLLKRPDICYGGGCTEYFTSKLVERKVIEDIENIKNEYRCTPSQILETLKIFLKSIAYIPLAINQGSILEFVTDPASNHLWKLQNGSFPSNTDKCLCGGITAEHVSAPRWTFLDKTLGEFLINDNTTNSEFKHSVDQHVLLDELGCKINGYSIAFEIASLLLRTSLCIQG